MIGRTKGTCDLVSNKESPRISVPRCRWKCTQRKAVLRNLSATAAAAAASATQVVQRAATLPLLLLQARSLWNRQGRWFSMDAYACLVISFFNQLRLKYLVLPPTKLNLKPKYETTHYAWRRRRHRWLLVTATRRQIMVSGSDTFSVDRKFVGFSCCCRVTVAVVCAQQNK